MSSADIADEHGRSSSVSATATQAPSTDAHVSGVEGGGARDSTKGTLELLLPDLTSDASWKAYVGTESTSSTTSPPLSGPRLFVESLPPAGAVRLVRVSLAADSKDLKGTYVFNYAPKLVIDALRAESYSLTATVVFSSAASGEVETQRAKSNVTVMAGRTVPVTLAFETIPPILSPLPASTQKPTAPN